MPKKSGPPSYRNIFTMDRLGKMPLILKDGTSVEFPSNWTKEEADIWRQHAQLLPDALTRAKPGTRQ